MSTQESLPIPVEVRVRVETLLRRTFAAACILGLAGTGVYGAWLARSDVNEVLIFLASTLAPAAAYAFGYFRCLPDALGAPGAAQKGTPWQRWSDYARLSAVVAILITWISWAKIIPTLSPIDAVKTLVALFVVTSVMPACVVASEEYLSRTMVRCDAMASTGWRSAAKRLAGQWGARLVKPLRAKRSMTLGSTLALASLFLNTTAEFGCNEIPHKGYEILAGKAVWVTAESAEGAVKVFVAQAGRCAYLLGIVICLATLAAALAGSAGIAWRRSRSLMVLTGSLALFFVSDYTFAWVRFGGPNRLVFAVWMVVWGLPVALWMGRARGTQGEWQYTRLAVMVLYLPIFLASLCLLVFLAPIAFGYISFLIGMLLVWWGLVQSQWEIAFCAKKPEH